MTARLEDCKKVQAVALADSIFYELSKEYGHAVAKIHPEYLKAKQIAEDTPCTCPPGQVL